MKTLANKNVKEERLPVLVGNATDVKLLGVAKDSTGSDLSSGDIIAEPQQTTCNLFESWNCKTEHVTMILFLIVIKKRSIALHGNTVLQSCTPNTKYFVLAFKLNF